ncbi:MULTISPECIES: hypothetical protein [Thalassobacter]|uniref:hypothetical protein n=1 Tax=Thalassobacter TaxID=266808 RepID=UPI00137733EA|nr:MULTISPECIES: hypothetical protein [Thalassobacter]
MGTPLKPTDFAQVMMLSTAARADLLEFFGSTLVQPSEINQLIAQMSREHSLSAPRQN